MCCGEAMDQPASVVGIKATANGGDLKLSLQQQCAAALGKNEFLGRCCGCWGEAMGDQRASVVVINVTTTSGDLKQK